MNNSCIFVKNKYMKTREEINARQRELRKQNNNAYTKKYERTKKGFLMRKYHHMMGRVKGEAWYKCVYLWAGKEILPKSEFYDWAIAQSEFHSLFEQWEKSGHERKLCPSVDRIDSKFGYVIGNMRWITFIENATLGARKRHNKQPHEQL
jgi:hypothetical protein